ncbi:hypothetical protein D9M71_709450 [compost metagenome]
MKINHLNAYSTACGDLPKLCSKGKAMVLVPMSEVIELKDSLLKILTDKGHTQYQNECYVSFLLRQVGLNHAV